MEPSKSREQAAEKKFEEALAFDQRGEWDKALAAHIEVCELEEDGRYLEYLARAWMRSDSYDRPALDSNMVWDLAADLGCAIMRVIRGEAE